MKVHFRKWVVQVECCCIGLVSTLFYEVFISNRYDNLHVEILASVFPSVQFLWTPFGNRWLFFTSVFNAQLFSCSSNPTDSLLISRVPTLLEVTFRQLLCSFSFSVTAPIVCFPSRKLNILQIDKMCWHMHTRTYALTVSAKGLSVRMKKVSEE